MNFAWHIQIWDTGFQRWGAFSSYALGDRSRALATAGKLAASTPSRRWRVVSESGETLWTS